MSAASNVHEGGQVAAPHDDRSVVDVPALQPLSDSRANRRRAYMDVARAAIKLVCEFGKAEGPLTEFESEMRIEAEIARIERVHFPDEPVSPPRGGGLEKALANPDHANPPNATTLPLQPMLDLEGGSASAGQLAAVRERKRLRAKRSPRRR